MLKLDLGVVNFTKGRIKVNLLKETILNTLKNLGVKENVEVSIAFVGEKRMKKFNKKFRGKDKVTDVLSFGFVEKSGAAKTKETYLNMGEIIICFPYAKKQAKKSGTSIDKELALLSAHGTIHLFGIDHERSKKESLETDKIQKKVLSYIFKK